MEANRNIEQSPKAEESNLVHNLRQQNESEARNKIITARRGGGATGLAGYDTPKLPGPDINKNFEVLDADPDRDPDAEYDLKQEKMSKTVGLPPTVPVGPVGNLNDQIKMPREESDERPPKLLVNTSPMAAGANKKDRYGSQGKGFDQFELESKIAEEDLKYLDASPIGQPDNVQEKQELPGPSNLTLHHPEQAQSDKDYDEKDEERKGEDDQYTEYDKLDLPQSGKKTDVLSHSAAENDNSSQKTAKREQEGEEVLKVTPVQNPKVNGDGPKDSEAPDVSPSVTSDPKMVAGDQMSKENDFTLEPKAVSHEPSRDIEEAPSAPLSQQVSLTGTAKANENNPLLEETMRLQRLEQMKREVKEKKVVEYESETIELYEMISSEFDFEQLRLESPDFNIKQYKDSIYRGEINKKRKRHGKGVVVYDNGRIYEGEWGDDKRAGRGFELFSNGNKYQGQYAAGKAHGKGTYTWTNGEVYEGEWAKGQKMGTGFWRGVQGDSYLGQWKQNKAEGYGVHTWIDGDRYEGEWRQCLRHGNGTDFFSNQDVYVGQYAAGKPEGFGQYKWANGNSYTGEFLNGMKHGKGKWKKRAGDDIDIGPGSKLGNTYDGYYELDKKHGYGEFHWESGNRYIGNYHSDERQGYGTMRWTDDSQYMGHWERGVQHGIGIMTFPDGVKRAGFFENNIYVIALKARHQISSLEEDMPDDILNQLLLYLDERQAKIEELRAQGVEDVEEHLDQQDQDLLGQPMRSMSKQPENEEPVDKVQPVRGMEQQLGVQPSPTKDGQDQFVNYEGLKRVYKPRGERETYQSELEKQAAMAKQGQSGPDEETKNLRIQINKQEEINRSKGSGLPTDLQVIEEKQEDGTVHRIVEKRDPESGLLRRVVEKRDLDGNLIETVEQNAIQDADGHDTKVSNSSEHERVKQRDGRRAQFSDEETNKMGSSKYTTVVASVESSQERKIEGPSREMEVQTDLNMETIFRYELSLNPLAAQLGQLPNQPMLGNNQERQPNQFGSRLRTPADGAKARTGHQGKNDSGKSDTLAKAFEGHSSSNQNHDHTTVGGATRKGKSQKAGAEHSDFGQMYRASEEFPNSFKRSSDKEDTNKRRPGGGVLVDQSISFTDLHAGDETRIRKIGKDVIKLEGSEKGTEKRDAAVNVELKKYAMLKTTQNLRSRSKNRGQGFFKGDEDAAQHGGSSFRGATSDEQLDQDEEDLGNQAQVSFPRYTGAKPAELESGNSGNLPKRGLQQLPHLGLHEGLRPSGPHSPAGRDALSPGEADGRAKLRVDDEIGNISVSEVSKLPAVPDRRSGMSLTQKRLQHDSGQDKSFFRSNYDTGLNDEEQAKHFATHEHRRDLQETPDVAAQSIDDLMYRRRASAFVDQEYVLDSPGGGPLKFNDFELVPRARETFHGPGLRGNLDLVGGPYIDHKQMRHTMYNAGDGQHYLDRIAQQEEPMGHNSSKQLITDTSGAVILDQLPAHGHNLMPQMLAANNDSVQNLVGMQSRAQLIQSLQQSHQQMPSARPLKKKKLKKVKGFRAKDPLVLRQGASTNRRRPSPIKIIKDSKRTASLSVKHQAPPGIFKPPLSNIRIAPQGYVSSSGVHSTSNRVAQIYRQPIVGFQSQSATKPPLPRPSGGSPMHSNLQSISTQEHSRQLNFALQQSLNQNAMLSSDNASMGGGLHGFAKKKYSAGAVLPTLENKIRAANHGTQLPPLNFKSLNYHQHQNSIQAIEVTNGSNNDGPAEALSDGQNDSSPRAARRAALAPIEETGAGSGKVGGKKKRKRVWIPASSVRRLGIDAAGHLVD